LTERLVIIGGDAGGRSAAAQARRRRKEDELEIVAFERGEFTSFSACGIPYFVGDIVTDVDDLIARTPEEHRRRGIDVRTEHEVTAIDLERRAVEVRPTDGDATTWESFDKLVIATGGTPLRPPIPGIEAEGIFGVQTLTDGIAVRAAVDPGTAKHAVVVGGGYIGLELAEALVQRGLDVALVDGAEQPMSTLDPDMGALVADALRDSGVELHLGEPVVEFEVTDGHVQAVRTKRATIPADLVILGLGLRPNSDLAAAAGIAVGEKTHGIVTDDRMRTSAHNVWAAGDCVETRHLVSGRPVSIALGTHANKQGRVVGINTTGGDATFPGVLGTAVSRICKYEVARTGLNEREAGGAGFDHVTATIDATNRAGYFPGSSSIKVKAIAQRGTGRILGAQIVGEEGAAKRIDIVATAIWNGMTADELINVDISYAPPFSPLWDPVLVAALQVAAAARG
jgi:NADPH-dependent 2,4-dienoyl-CoA reductase/sulfur reductase-like enzyme